MRIVGEWCGCVGVGVRMGVDLMDVRGCFDCFLCGLRAEVWIDLVLFVLWIV